MVRQAKEEVEASLKCLCKGSLRSEDTSRQREGDLAIAELATTIGSDHWRGKWCPGSSMGVTEPTRVNGVVTFQKFQIPAADLTRFLEVRPEEKGVEPLSISLGLDPGLVSVGKLWL